MLVLCVYVFFFWLLKNKMRTLLLKNKMRGTPGYVAERSAWLADDSRVLPASSEPRSLQQFAREVSTGDALVRGGAVWPLTGPRTCGDWVREAARNGYSSLVTRHETWKSDSGVRKELAAVYEHEVLSRSLHLAASFDALNVSALVSCELMARRLQLIESAVREDAAAPSFEGARHFMGVGGGRGGAFVVPSLQAHVAGELGKQAAILKEKRKAREAKQAVQKSTKGGGKAAGSGGGDH